MARTTAVVSAGVGGFQPDEPTPAACGGYPSEEGNTRTVFIRGGELEKLMGRFYKTIVLSIVLCLIVLTGGASRVVSAADRPEAKEWRHYGGDGGG